MVQRRPGRLGRKSSPPIGATEDPPYLQAGPSLGLPQSRAPDELTGLPLDHCPLAEPTQTPVTNEEGQLAPGRGPLERAAVTQVTPNLRIGADRGVRIEVRGLESTQQETLGHELGNHRASIGSA